jgi:serine/threonine protein kinase
MIEIHNLEENYKIVKRLGAARKRKFSEVYLIQSKKEASKTYILKYSSSALGIEQLQNESNYHFEHPSLPKIIDFKAEESSAYLILEFKNGITLSEYFNSVPARNRFEVCLEILDLLLPVFTELQRLKTAHLDVKPSNILVCKETNTIHLIDFGMTTSFSGSQV